MKILVTGFDPFGGESINPSWEAVKLLPDTIEGCQVVKQLLPCVFVKAGKVLDEAIAANKPDLILCVGQAGGRTTLCMEKVGINVMDGRIADNEGYQPVDVTIREDGETAYFTNLPIKAMVADMRAAGYPASVSYTAGSYVCNYIMYETLYFISKKYPGIKGGFMHIPFAPEQAANNKTNPASMPIATIAGGLEVAIASALKHKDDIKVNEGETH